MKAHFLGKAIKPQNKLQEWAFEKGLTSGYKFCNAMVQNDIVSHGTAMNIWTTGKVGSSRYSTVLAITKFLGAERIEDVFDT